MIRSVSNNILNKTLLFPSHKIKQISQEHLLAKTVKIGISAVSKESRMNPDTSYGAHVTIEIQAKARAGQQAKEIKQVQKEAAKTVSTQKVANNAKKRKSLTTVFVHQSKRIQQSIYKHGCCQTTKMT